MNQEEKRQQLAQMDKDKLIDEIIKLENEVNVLKITGEYDERDRSRMRAILTSISIALEAYNKR